jgi:Zn-dependent protease with chaperone function
VVFARHWVGPLTRWSTHGLEIAAALASLAATATVHFRLLRRVLPEPPTLRYWLTGVVTQLIVIRPVLPIAVVLALAAPESLWTAAGATWVAVALTLVALAMGGVTLLGARALGLARPPSQRLEAIVDTAAERAGQSPRATFELIWPMVNAAAFPMGGVLVFSDAALRTLDDDELEAIAAHELGHLSEPRSIQALRMMQAALWVPLAAARPIVVAYDITGLGVAVLAIMTAILLLGGVMRRMERRADAQARKHEGDSGSLARALEKIYRANAVPAVGWARGSHPHLYDRLIAAGKPPSYDRPKPPSRIRLYLGMVAAMLVTATLLIAATWAPTYAACAETEDEWPCVVWLASGYGGSWELGAIGYIRETQGQHEDAIVLYRAAAILADNPSAELARLVVLLVLADRCPEAEATAEQLKQQIALTPASQDHLDYAQALLDSCTVVPFADAGVDPP